MRAASTSLAVPNSAFTVLAGALVAACAVSGHGPLWMLPVWALALGLWCLSERRRTLVLALPVLLALLPAWPAHAELLAFTGVYLRLALSGLAAALFVQTLDERGHWWGLILLGLAWATAPSALGLFGLLAAALLRAQAVQRGSRQVVSGRAVGWLLGLVALVALGSALLPRPAWSGLDLPTGQQQIAPLPAQPQPPAPVPRPALPSRPSPLLFAPVPPLASFAFLERLTPFLLLAFALLSSTLLMLAWRERASRLRERHRLEDLVLVAALVVGYLMVLLYFWVRARGHPGGAAGGDQGASGVSTTPTDPSQLPHAPPSLLSFLNGLGWIGVAASLLFLLLAAVGVVWMFRLRLAAGSGVAAAASPATVPPALSPEHRVRRAYRLMLAALSAAGLARAGSETPQEFLTRLGSSHPELAGATRTITVLYEPVRYGGQTDESGAQAAEGALAQLQTHLERPI